MLFHTWHTVLELCIHFCNLQCIQINTKDRCIHFTGRNTIMDKVPEALPFDPVDLTYEKAFFVLTKLFYRLTFLAKVIILKQSSLEKKSWCLLDREKNSFPLFSCTLCPIFIWCWVSIWMLHNRGHLTFKDGFYIHILRYLWFIRHVL